MASIARSERSMDRTQFVPLSLATVSIAAGLIHASVVPHHLEESTILGVAFVATAFFQIAWAAPVSARLDRRILDVQPIGVEQDLQRRPTDPAEAVDRDVPHVHLDTPEPGVSQDQTIRTRVRWRIRMNEPASSEDRRRRLDLLVDEASMLSFPASDPPAVFVEEPEPSIDRITNAGVPNERHARSWDTVRDKRELGKSV